jgi:hypothetical protein
MHSFLPQVLYKVLCLSILYAHKKFVKKTICGGKEIKKEKEKKCKKQFVEKKRLKINKK